MVENEYQYKHTRTHARTRTQTHTKKTHTNPHKPKQTQTHTHTHTHTHTGEIWLCTCTSQKFQAVVCCPQLTVKRPKTRVTESTTRIKVLMITAIKKILIELNKFVSKYLNIRHLTWRKSVRYIVNTILVRSNSFALCKSEAFKLI